MTINKFAFSSGLAGVAVAAVIGAAPWAAAEADITPTPAHSTPATAASVAPAPPGIGGGPVALPPGGPAVIYPQDQVIGGADPSLPFGSDPLVPYGTWAP